MVVSTSHKIYFDAFGRKISTALPAILFVVGVGHMIENLKELT
jgi:hypothetical protein